MTLCTSQNELFQRATSELTEEFASFLRKPKIRKAKKLHKRWTVRKLYRSASNLITLYEVWSEFIDDCGVAKHLILDPASSGDTIPRLYDSGEVKKLLKG